MSTLKAKVILNVKTSTDWAISPLILLEGELGIESDTHLIKIGNGIDTWGNLSYTAISDISNIEGVTITSPTDGQVLTYSNGEWINVTPSALPADTDLSHYDNTTSGFITASDIPALPADTDLSHYNNTNSDFATVSQIPTDVSQLNNDAGYVTSSAIPTVNDGTINIQQNGSNVGSFTTNQSTNDTINITVPTNISAFNNDVGYLTSASLPSVNDGTLTIQKNSSTIGTFSANSAINSTIDLIVPTKTSDLVNDSNFAVGTINNGTLTIKQEGNTIATFSANSAVDVVANISGGGGGGGGASYTSQLTVDSGLIPDTDAVYQLGDSTHRWTYLYSEYLSTGDGSDTIVEQSILPSIDSNFNLGSSSYAWDNVYTDSIVLNGNTYTSIPTDTSELTNNAGFITSAALPTVNDGTLTIQKNSTTIDTFTANSSTNVTVDITVPTDTTELTNNAGFITLSDIPALPSDTDLSHYDNTDSDFVDSNALATKQDVIDNANPLSASYVSGLAAVATSGDYTDLINTPTVPTKTSDLVNDSGFIGNPPLEYVEGTPDGTILLNDNSVTTNYDPQIKLYGGYVYILEYSSGSVIINKYDESLSSLEWTTTYSGDYGSFDVDTNGVWLAFYSGGQLYRKQLSLSDGSELWTFNGNLNKNYSKQVVAYDGVVYFFHYWYSNTPQDIIYLSGVGLDSSDPTSTIVTLADDDTGYSTTVIANRPQIVFDAQGNMYKFLTCAASNGRLVVVSKYDANNLTNRLWARQIGNIGYHSTYYQTPIGLAVDNTYTYISYNLNGQAYGSIEVVDISNGNSVAVHNLASNTRVQSINADNNGYIYVLYSNTVINGGDTWAGDTYTIDKIKVSDWSTVWSKTISATSVAYTRTGNTTIYGDKLWSVIYTDSTQVTEIQSNEIRDVLNVAADIIPNSSKYNIGSNLDKWNFIYGKQFRIAANTLMYSADDKALWFKWYDDANSVSRYACFEDDYFYPTSNNAISLGKTGDVWKNVYTTNLILNGTSYNSIPANINDLGDVTITSATTNDYLKYDGSKWINTAFPTIPTTLGALTDVTISSASNGQYLKYDGSKWVNTNFPTIPTVYNATLTLQLNGTDITNGTFTANASSNKTINVAALPISGGTLTGDVITKTLKPNGNLGGNLGDNSNYYSTLYIGTINCRGVTTIGTNTNPGVLTVYGTIGSTGAISASGNMSCSALTTTGQISCGGALSVNGHITRSSGDLVVQAQNGAAVLNGSSAVRLRSASASAGNAGTNLRRYANVTAGKSGDENPIVTYTGSDIRMKQDISEVYLNGLDCINKIHLVNFRYKTEDSKHYKHLGVIAQEVEKDIPEAKDIVLHGDDDEKDMLYVEYGMFAPYLIKAVQELSSKVDELNAKIKELESKK